MRVFIFFLLLINSIAGYTQQKKARLHIQILASDSLAGRGYVENGQKKAAKFITDELTRYGISNRSQNLTYSVNTFPDSIIFSSLADTILKAYNPGTDFLIHPSSTTIRFKEQNVINLSIDKLEEKSLKLKSKKVYSISRSSDNAGVADKFIASFLEENKFNKSLLIVQDSGKLTWFPSQTQSKNAVVYLKKPLGSKVNAQWNTQLKNNFSSENIVAKISGRRSDSVVMFSAHYDHLGKMGLHAIFPGAHDNASGVAMLLTLSDYFSDHTPEYDTFFLFTTGEELGLLGSYYFIQNPLFDLRKIKLLINLDLLGTGEEGIMVVNAKKHDKVYQKMQSLNADIGIPEIKARGEACNSDHCFFDQMGVPAIYIYTLGGRKAYHDIEDKAEGLSLFGFNDIQQLIINLSNQL